MSTKIQASCADDCRSNVKFHVVEWSRGYWAAACGTGRDGVTMMSHQTVDAKSISQKLRCLKPGCVAAFAKADAT